jgi:hypothetical protein
MNPSTLLLFFGPTAFLFVIHYCEWRFGWGFAVDVSSYACAMLEVMHRTTTELAPTYAPTQTRPTNHPTNRQTNQCTGAVPIESEAADPSQFPSALARSMALTAILDIVVGCVVVVHAFICAAYAY